MSIVKLFCTITPKAPSERSEHTVNAVLSCSQLCSAPGSAQSDTPTDPSGDVSSLLESLGRIAFNRGMDKRLSALPLDQEGRAVLKFKSPEALCAEAWYWGTPSTGPISSQVSGHSSPSASILPSGPHDPPRLPIPPKRPEHQWLSTYRAPDLVEMDEALARGDIITRDEAFARAADKIDAEKKRQEALVTHGVANKAAWTPSSSLHVGAALLTHSSSALNTALPVDARASNLASTSTSKHSSSVGDRCAHVKNGAISLWALSQKVSKTSTSSDARDKPSVPESYDYPSTCPKGSLKRALHEDDAKTSTKRYKLKGVG